MKAAVFTALETITVQEKPKPEVGPGQALVKIERCGICGSDLHGYKIGPVLEIIYAFGTVMGHECSGVVVETGPGVSDFQNGDRVAICPVTTCGTCDTCIAGKNNICLNGMMNSIGMCTWGDGAFAEYLLVKNPGQTLYKLPDHVSFDEAALIEPLATSLHGVRQSRLKPGDITVVIGAGPIGLGTIQFLKLGGAARIIVLEVSAERSRIALELGADMVLNPLELGSLLPLKMAELTGGVGADIVFECSGVPFGFQNAINFMKSGGQVMVVGIADDTVISPLMLTIKEAEMKGSFAYTNAEFKMSLDFLAQKRINNGPMVTEVIALDDIQVKGFQRLMSSKDAVKILVRP